MKKIIIFFLLIVFSPVVFSQSQPEGLFIDSKAPDFRGKDQQGNEIRLKDQLKKGRVVLVFYRGYWCPYCNKELSRLQDSLQLILDKGAFVIAVTPEKPENISKTVEQTKASYPVIYDEGLKIMKAYEVAFEVPENTLTRYRNANIDIEKNNGENGKWLPVPAVYIIDKDSRILFRFFETDYKKRPSVAQLLENL
jgi:peroxiredoxin